jgi:hypothetical protein
MAAPELPRPQCRSSAATLLAPIGSKKKAAVFAAAFFEELLRLFETLEVFDPVARCSSTAIHLPPFRPGISVPSIPARNRRFRGKAPGNEHSAFIPRISDVSS